MKIKNLIARLSIIGLIAYAVSPSLAQAAEVTSRSTTVTNSAGAATGVGYAVRFTFGTSGQTIGSIKIEICDSPLAAVACVNSGNSSGANFTSTSTGTVTVNAGTWGNAGTCALDDPNTTGNTAYIDCTVGAITATPTVTLNLNSVANPTAVNVQYYVRVTTYTDTGATLPSAAGTDFGGMALSTTQQITVSGTMPESLVFCVGTVWTTDCTDISGSSVNLGTFSPTATSTGTSVMSASTNAGSGYVITINGTTLTSGANTITAMGTQSLNDPDTDPSTTGSSQFGSNVRDNATPNVGTNVSGSGTATGSGGYNVVDGFRFFTGDTVASVGAPTNSNVFTNSYIVNVGGSQAAGLYTATMTYICTATF